MRDTATELNAMLSGLLPTLLVLIVLLMAAEAAWLVLTHRASRPRLGALGAGAALVLSWRLGLAGLPSVVVLAGLGVAGACHVWGWWRPRR